MKTVPMKLVTIVAERLIKEPLLREIKALGASGYTLTDTHGEGTRGVRASEWEGPDVKIETLVPEAVATRIIDHVAEHYFEYHALIVYTQTVEVVRGDKYR